MPFAAGYGDEIPDSASSLFGTWLTDSPEYASQYASKYLLNDPMQPDKYQPIRDVFPGYPETNPTVYPVNLQAKNPYRMDWDEFKQYESAATDTDLQGRLFEMGDADREAFLADRANAAMERRAALQAEGYDSIEVVTPDGVRQVAVFDSANAPMAWQPNSEFNRRQNLVERDAAWRALETATKNAGVKRNKSGRYVGGPEGVLSPQKRTAVVNKYAERTQNALDAGIPPGYFYEQGRGKLAEITDSPEEHALVAGVYGPTSTQVGPRSNTDYVIRSLDQDAMGVPINVGLYPNTLRPKIEATLRGEDPWKGYKVDRYSHLLGPVDPHVNPLQNMPPNDQWEGFGVGFDQGYVPSGPTQVAWADDIRRRAADKINAKRAAEGKKPLTSEEIQELHWAAIRAETEGRPLQLNPGDTLQGSFPQFRAQSAWEAEPGASSGMQRLGTKEEYADAIYQVLADDQGKDRLVRSMGGRLQEPIVRGTGVWEGELSPGFQSPSFASHTKVRGMEPASKARLDATESVRQYMLGQEGAAYGLMQDAPTIKARDIAEVKTGSTPSPEQTAEIQARIGENGIVIPTAEGYRIKSMLPEGEGKAFTDLVGEIAPDAEFGKDVGNYMEMDWAGGNATSDLLGRLDESGMPGPARLADSAQTREIAGEIADVYRRLEAEGKLAPNQKLTRALEVWRERGLEGLRELVQQGLAPAVLLALFAGSQGESDQREQVLR